MRVAPRPLISVGLVAIYMAIIGLLWAVQGVEYTRVGETTGSLVSGMVLPVAAGAVFLTAATSYLGWWRPALVEQRRAPRWLWVVPVLFVLPGVGFLLGFGTEQSTTWLLTLAVGVLLVGFAEEMLTRGTGLVGLRGRFAEPAAWFFSCLLFGLIHALNALFGQGALTTVVQIGSAFVAGTVLYLLRRLAGSLVPCMLGHAFWDFTSFNLPADAVDSGSPWLTFGLAQNAAFVIALVGVFLVLRKDLREDSQGEASSDGAVPSTSGDETPRPTAAG